MVAKYDDTYMYFELECIGNPMVNGTCMDLMLPQEIDEGLILYIKCKVFFEMSGWV